MQHPGMSVVSAVGPVCLSEKPVAEACLPWTASGWDPGEVAEREAYQRQSGACPQPAQYSWAERLADCTSSGQ